MINIFNKKTFQVAFVVVVTVVFIFFIQSHLDYLKKAASMSPLLIVAVISMDILSKACSGLKIKIVLKKFGIRLSFKEWYGLSSMSAYYNYFFSKSGTVLAATYVRKKYGFNYSKYAGFLMGDVATVVIASGVLGTVASLLWENFTKNSTHSIVVVSFFILFVMASLVFFIPKFRLPKRGIMTKINSAMDGWYSVKAKPDILVAMFFLNMAIIVIFAIRYYVLFRVFSDPVPFSICCLVSPLANLTQILSVVPSAYGLREAVMGGMTKLYDFGFVSGAIVSIIDRVIMMLVFFILGPLFTYMLMKKTGYDREDRRDAE
ncbi:MAG TPA: lysylphosphatidylglycerol synthase transmembrane domain-containing protein [Candidatus Omnitrophota bacterium]|nr:lysylphosphatidylglycerol synthase transmembrane domain-containing protein [Candidatus Omnitrophota bacterium]